MNVVFAAAVVSLSIGAQIEEKTIEAELRKALTTHNVPALGAAIVSSKGVQTLAVTGVRKRGSATKVTKDDRFHLGSDTKAMTATLIALLIEQKLLAWDETMAKAFPELAAKMNAEFKNVTLEQLLAHRAGLPASLEIPSWKRPVKDPIRRQRQETAVKALSVAPSYKPGSKFEYSNVGYVLAGAIAERVGKASWEDLLKKRLFGPLKMTSAGFGPMGTRGKVDQPLGHEEDGKPMEADLRADNLPVLGPAGRVHCNLADWAKFLADQLKGGQGKDGLLPSAAYSKLHSPANKGEDYSPGGWKVLFSNGEPVGLGHDGSNTYHFATAVVFPKLDLAVMVVCNQGGKPGKNATHEVREKLLELVLEQMMKQKD